jgi:2-amino-4-hydroxy-6-hydroxymethyldihydropteridine diphosphokinase
MAHRIYLGLGTNLGDRLKNLHAAVDSLSPTVKVLRTSAIYETQPWGYIDQPSFLNMAVEGDTEIDPGELLASLKQIEVNLGREVTFRYGPRLIDLDILFYDQLVLDLPHLKIPHPHLAERAFVLIPLMDLAPDLKHPVLQVTISELAARLPDEIIYKVEDVS